MNPQNAHTLGVVILVVLVVVVEFRVSHRRRDPRPNGSAVSRKI